MKDKPEILIVDDIPQNIRLLEAFMIPQGYEIFTAANGKEALSKLDKNQIDLILLDVMMPDMDGYEVTKRIRQNERTRLLPIILVTALHDTKDRVTGIEAGCDDFISKPVDKTEVVARVKSLLKVKAYNDLMQNYQKELESAVAARTEELKKATEKIKTASLDTIFRLATASEYKDKDTGAHIKRMSLYCAAIARCMGLDESASTAILHAAPMHDIGKIGIPDRILAKTDYLSSAEREIMKQHTIIGAKILEGSDSEFIRLGRTIALSHHEKWDGSGYPNGLKGKDIPLAGRLAAIADVFDALTSSRPYKEPFSLEKSLNVIRRWRETTFDPDIVDVFFTIQPQIIEIKEQCCMDIPYPNTLPALHH